MRIFYSFCAIITCIILVLSASNDNIATTQPRKKDLIFDLGDVLVSTNKAKAFFTLGFLDTISFMLSTGNKPNEELLLHFLEHVDGKQTHKPYAHSGSGKILPRIMCKWLTGTLTNKQVRDKCFAYIQNNPKYFSTKQHKKMIEKLITITFTPKLFISTRHMMSKRIKQIKKLKKNGHRIFILSNWDRESFALLREKYTTFFESVDGILISGDSGLIKPDPAIYHALINAFDLDPRNCIFIDDRVENTTSAQTCGMHAITLPQNDSLTIALNKQLSTNNNIIAIT